MSREHAIYLGGPENQHPAADGREIGVTLHHPHGQISAFPFVAPRLAQMMRGRFGAHLQVLSVRRAANKLKYLAGTESGMGDIVPDEAAQRLREACSS